MFQAKSNYFGPVNASRYARNVLEACTVSFYSFKGYSKIASSLTQRIGAQGVGENLT